MYLQSQLMYSCETVWVKRCLYQKDGSSQKLQYKHYIGKNKQRGKGGRVKDMEFSVIK